ncbi:MAG: hypothetical protein IPK67_07845 [Planctomycetes bacterium]|nr:hypothetical protein [Planctomycetota bacterium]
MLRLASLWRASLLAALSLAPILALGACAASPAKINDVARTEAARMMRPSKALSSFASYELKPLALGTDVQADPKKVAESAKLEERLKGEIEPLLTQWRMAPAGARSGTLVIEPQLAGIRIISGGARFWAGAMAGDSSIDLDLVLTEKESGLTLAKARVARDASGTAGGWSVGRSDQNLHQYIAAIAREYLVAGY